MNNVQPKFTANFWEKYCASHTNNESEAQATVAPRLTDTDFVSIS